jgi:hypothetical protein
MQKCKEHLISQFMSNLSAEVLLLSIRGLTNYSFSHILTWIIVCAVAQVVNHWPLTTEAWVRTHVNSCGMCGGQSGAGTCFSQSAFIFPCQYHSTMAHHAHIISGMSNRPMVATVQRLCLTPSMTKPYLTFHITYQTSCAKTVFFPSLRSAGIKVFKLWKCC